MWYPFNGDISINSELTLNIRNKRKQATKDIYSKPYRSCLLSSSSTKRHVLQFTKAKHPSYYILCVNVCTIVLSSHGNVTENKNNNHHNNKKRITNPFTMVSDDILFTSWSISSHTITHLSLLYAWFVNKLEIMIELPTILYSTHSHTNNHPHLLTPSFTSRSLPYETLNKLFVGK